MSLTLAFNGFFTKESSGGGGYDFENALTFDGVNDNLTGTALTAPNDFTLSVWLKPEISTASFQRFWLTENTGNDRVFFYQTEVFWRATGATNEVRWSYDYRNDVGAWHHYCFSRIGTAVRFYVDSVEQSYSVQNGNSSGFTAGTIMFNITQGQYPYKGLADEWAFKIGTGATQSDVDAIWNSGNGAAFDTVIASPDQYLKFNEATSYTGSTVADSSGNGNSMTMNNFTGTPFVPH